MWGKRFFKNKPIEGDRQIIELVKRIFGYSPRNILLFADALRHKSASKNIHNNAKDSNERLEFLGDAVLDSVVAQYLYEKHPNADEGELTKMRSRIVSRASLNKLGRDIGILDVLETDSQAITSKWSLCGNALEALIGAVFLDKGYEFTRTRTIELIDKFLILSKLKDEEVDFKSRLFEVAHRQKKTLDFVTEVLIDEGPGISYKASAILGGELLGSGKGSSKKKAEQASSEEALRKLN